MMGKIAITVAHSVNDASVSFTRMMISGATATIGVTCSSTAYGIRLNSISRLCTNRKAISVPTTTEAAKAISVTLIVLHSPCSSTGQFSESEPAISVGDGKR